MMDEKAPISYEDIAAAHGIPAQPIKHLRPGVRELSPEEMADLPAENWLNFSEDPRLYRASFSVAYAVTAAIYEECLADGALCQNVSGIYVVTNG